MCCNTGILISAKQFAVEPINNDDLDSERLRWRGRDDCWHYAAQFHVFLSCSGRQSYLRLILAPCASLTALATYSPECPAHSVYIQWLPASQTQHKMGISLVYCLGSPDVPYLQSTRSSRRQAATARLKGNQR